MTPDKYIKQTFGWLRASAVVSRGDDYLLLRCQCFCGRICNVKSSDLESGEVESCHVCEEERAA